MLLTKGREIDCLFTGSLGNNKAGSITAKSKLLELKVSWFDESGNFTSQTLNELAKSIGEIIMAETILLSFKAIAIV